MWLKEHTLPGACPGFPWQPLAFSLAGNSADIGGGVSSANLPLAVDPAASPVRAVALVSVCSRGSMLADLALRQSAAGADTVALSTAGCLATTGGAVAADIGNNGCVGSSSCRQATEGDWGEGGGETIAFGRVSGRGPIIGN